jgi:hypothetical protein
MEYVTNMWEESLKQVWFLCSLTTRKNPAVPHRILSISMFQNIALQCRGNLQITIAIWGNYARHPEKLMKGRREAETSSENAAAIDALIINLKEKVIRMTSLALE